MRYLLITILVFAGSHLIAQRDIKENVHVMTNYSQLISGETLKYSAFCRSEVTGKLSSLSKVLYVQLIGESGVVFEQKVSLRDGVGNGEFFINSLIPTGTYQLIAHTLWMKNFGDYYQVPITIINPFESLPEREIIESKLLVQVPGGRLLKGIPNYVHYRLTGNGNERFSLKLIGEEGQILEDELVELNTSGKFEITPTDFADYKFILEASSGDISFHQLPGVIENGYTIGVDRKSKGLQITPNNPFDSNNEQLTVQISNLERPLTNRTAFSNTSIFIDDDELPKGLITIELLNGRNSLAQYSFWNQPILKSENIEKYECRELIPFEIDSPVGHYSISVTKEEGEFNHYRDIIYNYSLSHFRKSTEEDFALQNLISQAEWMSWNYVKEERDTVSSIQVVEEELTGSEYKRLYNQAKKDLYNVISGEEKDKLSVLKKHNLLQEEKERNNGFELLEVNYLPEAREELLIGNAYGSDGLPSENEEVYFAIAGKPGQLRTAITDNQGRFVLQYKSTNSSAKAFLKLNSGEGSFEVVPKFYQEPKSFNYQPPYLDSIQVASVVQRSIRNQLFHSYNNLKSEPESRKSNFLPQFEEFDFNYILDDFTRFETFKEYIVEYMLGVSIKNKKIQISQKYYRPDFNKDQLILLDGVPVDESKILEYNPALIERIGIFNNRFYLGNSAFDGVMYIETYKGDFQGYEENSLYPIDVIPVLSNAIDQFSGPKNERVPDMRDELYWNPNIKNTSGSLSFDVMTSDVSGKFMVQIEGVTKDGNPISKSLRFVVE